MKKLFLISGAFASIIGPVATVVACGDEDEKDEKKIAMILSTKNNPFFQQLAKGAEDEAKKQGYKLKVYVSNNDQAEETKKIDLAISEGYKTLILNGLDARQSAANAKKAIDAGIKVIAVDRPLSEEAKV
jgi:ABC-type sugar transport system substrate-binding protein